MYQSIASELQEIAVERTWQQCQLKYYLQVQKGKPLKVADDKYLRLTNNYGVSGSGRTTCPFYEEVDAMLGTLAASSPAVLLESSDFDWSGKTKVLCIMCFLCFLKKSLILGLHNLQQEVPPLHSHSVFLLPLLRMMRGKKMKFSVSINLVQINM